MVYNYALQDGSEALGQLLWRLLPRDVAERKGIKENDEVEVVIRKAADIQNLFGKYRVDDVQRLKDELREGWS